MPLKTTPWDTAEFLDTSEMRAAYWDEVLADFEETGDAAFMQGVSAPRAGRPGGLDLYA